LIFRVIAGLLGPSRVLLPVGDARLTLRWLLDEHAPIVGPRTDSSVSMIVGLVNVA